MTRTRWTAAAAAAAITALAGLATPAGAAMAGQAGDEESATISDQVGDAPPRVDVESMDWRSTGAMTVQRLQVRDLKSWGVVRVTGAAEDDVQHLVVTKRRAITRQVYYRNLNQTRFCPQMQVDWDDAADTITIRTPNRCLFASAPGYFYLVDGAKLSTKSASDIVGTMRWHP